MSDNFKEISLKYFKKGHTFVSADSFYHQVEKNIKGRKLYYFKGFVTCVGKSRIAIEMNFFDSLIFKRIYWLMASGGRVHSPSRKTILEKNGKCNQYDFYKPYQNPLGQVLNQFSKLYLLWGLVMSPLLEVWYTRDP